MLEITNSCGPEETRIGNLQIGDCFIFRPRIHDETTGEMNLLYVKVHEFEGRDIFCLTTKSMCSFNPDYTCWKVHVKLNVELY